MAGVQGSRDGCRKAQILPKVKSRAHDHRSGNALKYSKKLFQHHHHTSALIQQWYRILAYIFEAMKTTRCSFVVEKARQFPVKVHSYARQLLHHGNGASHGGKPRGCQGHRSQGSSCLTSMTSYWPMTFDVLTGSPCPVLKDFFQVHGIAHTCTVPSSPAE